MDVGPSERFGNADVRADPWLDQADLPWPLGQSFAEDLTGYGVPLSLAAALADSPTGAEEMAVLEYLSALVECSPSARDQLNMHKAVPLVVSGRPCKKKLAFNAKIDQLCKSRLGETEHRVGECDWSRWAASYEIWLQAATGELTKMEVSGVQRAAGAAFDLGGMHLTGGRIWAGSLMMLRWAASLTFEDALKPGEGRLLEVGSGIGVLGIGLAKVGHQVVLSDREPSLLQRIQENIDHNDVQDQCRVLDLDWGAAGEPKMRRLLARQKFQAVVGADLIYEGSVQAELLCNVLRHALPEGGLGLFINALRHRRGVQRFPEALRQRGWEVTEGHVPCTGILQDVLCGAHEPGQEYTAWMVRITPEVTSP